MWRRVGLHLVGLIVFLSSLGCMAMAEQAPELVEVTQVYEPAAEEPEDVYELTPVPESTLSPLPILTQQPVESPMAEYASAYEKRRIILDWPSKLREGDSDLVRLTLEIDNQDTRTPTALFDEHETRTVPVKIPDLYETHDVYVEAELNLAGVVVEPDNLSRKLLERGQSISFDWSILAEQSGNYRGSVQMSMVYINKEDGKTVVRSLPPQAFKIEVVNLFGLGGSAARLLGGIGVFISSLFGAGDILELSLRVTKRFLKKGDEQS